MANDLAVRRMTKRGRNGPYSRQWHYVRDGASRYRVALCGTKPAAPGAYGTKGIMGESGWSVVAGEHVTCPKCILHAHGSVRTAA